MSSSTASPQSRRRRRAYARGREDARRAPLDDRERWLVRQLAGGHLPDQDRAYWLGVLREARS